MMPMSDTLSAEDTRPRAGTLRRLAAIVYDSFLLLALLFIAAALTLPLTHGKAIGANNPFFTTYLFFVSFFFFAWFWTHGGQTLGMRAWRLRIETRHGRPVGWWHALLRFLSGLPAWLIFALGLFHWMLPDSTALPTLIRGLYHLPAWLITSVGALMIVWDHSPWSWRDRFSETRVVRLSGPARNTTAGIPQS